MSLRYRDSKRRYKYSAQEVLKLYALPSIKTFVVERHFTFAVVGGSFFSSFGVGRFRLGKFSKEKLKIAGNYSSTTNITSLI